MSDEEARVAVLVGPGAVELRSLPLPAVPDDGALLRIEACGVCGTDVEVFSGELPVPYPIVPGHEPVGRVVRIGPEARRRWKVGEGDRLAMMSALACGRCEACLRGERCTTVGSGAGGYGSRPPDLAPGLWGGFGTHLYLPPAASFVPMDPTLPVPVAALYNALTNGFDWVVRVGMVQPDDEVVVFGPGPRGLACVIAARLSGAGRIVVVGLPHDRGRLQAARQLGADATEVIAVPDAELAEAAASVLGRGADLVIDATPRAAGVVAAAVMIARRGGRIVLAGLKGPHREVSLPVDTIVQRQLTIRGALGKSVASMVAAVGALEQHTDLFHSMPSTAYPLHRLQDAVHAVAAGGSGASPGPAPIHVHVAP